MSNTPPKKNSAEINNKEEAPINMGQENPYLANIKGGPQLIRYDSVDIPQKTLEQQEEWEKLMTQSPIKARYLNESGEFVKRNSVILTQAQSECNEFEVSKRIIPITIEKDEIKTFEERLKDVGISED